MWPIARVGFRPFGHTFTQFWMPWQRNTLNGSSSFAKRSSVAVSRLSARKRYDCNRPAGPIKRSGFHQNDGQLVEQQAEPLQEQLVQQREVLFLVLVLRQVVLRVLRQVVQVVLQLVVQRVVLLEALQVVQQVVRQVEQQVARQEVQQMVLVVVQQEVRQEVLHRKLENR